MSTHAQKMCLSLKETKTGKSATPSCVRAETAAYSTIHLSRVLRRVLTARKLIRPALDTRDEKISALRDRIQKGTYTINYEITSARVLRAFVDEQDDSVARYHFLPLVEAISLS